MISVEDCEFIKKFEVANSEEKQIILTSEGHQVSIPLSIFFICIDSLVMPELQIVLGLLPHESRRTDQCVVFFFHCHGAFTCLFVWLFFFQCAKTFLNLMAHISKEQTVQYILTLIDDTLQVETEPLCAAK